MRLAKVEADLVIYDQTPEELMSRFDGLIPSDGLSIANVKGKKILNECLGLKFTEIIEFNSDGEEIVFLQKNAELRYYPSNNKMFNVNDIIRIDEKGDYIIILTPMFAFLYNSETQTTIEMDSISNINEVKLYLEHNYPEYIVLRKIT